jgi:raffinose/stachyose/melibiose transport system substrate-binding protein
MKRGAMKKRFLTLTWLFVFTMMLTHCEPYTIKTSPGASAASAETQSSMAPVVLTIIQNKVEVGDVFNRIAIEYERENPGVKVNVETHGGGEDFSTWLTAQFQSDITPDIFTNDGYALLDPWLYTSEDLSDQPWVKDLFPGSATPITRMGKIYGMPEAYEGLGFAYSKKLFEKAKITELPSTLSELEDVCRKLSDSGIQPFANTYAEWWVLGNHSLNIPLAQQPSAKDFINNIALRKNSFSEGTNVMGWVHLLDLTVKYGQYNSTATGDYATTVSDFASGKAAMIQQGNWIQPMLDKINPDLDVGFLPMPISNVSDKRIVIGVPNFFVVNRNSANKQEAKKWLNWLVTSQTGQQFITEELKYIPCLKTIPNGTLRGLNAAIVEKINRKETYSWEFPRLPSGSSMNIAIALSKYIDKKISAEGLFLEIDRSIQEGMALNKKIYGASIY